MLLYLFLLCSHFIALGSMNSINPETTEEKVEEGGNINLTCTYDGQIQNIQWYRENQRSRPEFLLYITEGGLVYKQVSYFSAHINKTEKRVNLEISSAALTDSAVYYCALQPGTTSGWKIYFGKGVTLTVDAREKHEPSYHKLQGNDTAACLATGFTQINEVNETLFKRTEAVRISDGSVYTQVAVLTTEDTKQKCDELAASSGDCGDPLNRDPMVNLMSLTVVGLRLIFIKTIIFNVLMTFKLWMSQ